MAYAKVQADDMGIIPIIGEVNTDMAEVVVECIDLALKRGFKTITFHIDTNGGWNDSCNAIIAKMNSLPHIDFTGLVMGKARSNGLRLLQHCTNRLAFRSSTIQFHWGSLEMKNGDLAAIMDNAVIDPIAHRKRTLGIIAQEIADATGLSLEKLYALARYEQDLNSEEAMEFGFLDEILPDLPAKRAGKRLAKGKKEKVKKGK